MKNILVLPGGGACGIITCKALSNFQKSINKPLHEYYDIIYSTSTGAIIGSMLAAGIHIDIILEMYLKEIPHIFTPQNSWMLPWRKFTRPLYDISRVTNPMKEILKTVGITKYGELKTKFVCTSVNVNTKENVFFKSTSEKYKDFDLVDIVSRSFSAPMYFGFRKDSENIYWADGGIGINNNPLLPAFIETVPDLLNGEQIDFTHFGTGYSDVSDSSSVISSWENVGEVWNLFLQKGDTLARIQSMKDSVAALSWLSEKVPNIRFKTFDVEIPKKMNKIDGKEFTEAYQKYGASITF
jgi:predicted acylesterase/phospholipase RssA